VVRRGSIKELSILAREGIVVAREYWRRCDHWIADLDWKIADMAKFSEEESLCWSPCFP